MTGNTGRLNAALEGRYKIEKQLGQGGMATVYLAQDIKHDRKVAVKVLKPELAAVLGAERFVVEIKTTAALQHPHILPLFDSGTADGFLYYVMPYIEGETLRGKLDRETQFSVDEAVRITSQVADALDYAHRHGVIHRDIKPENILLHDGRPMVADFGIALAVSAAAGGRMTETGLSLGTPHYMSPEQATAEKEITGRSDIYSLASVLYEMLTGNPPHMGASAQQIIMKIITEQAAPVTNLRKAVPPNVAAALAKALEKLPADRFETAKAFADALTNQAFTSTSSPDARVLGLGSRALGLPFVIVASIATVLAISTGALLLRRPASPPVSRYKVELAEGWRLSFTQWAPLAASPDGSNLVYTGESDRLVLRSRDKLEAVELAGTEGAFNPFFSRDGKKVGFMSGPSGNSDVKFVSLAGGPPTLVASGLGGPGAAWGYDGFIYVDGSGIGPLKRVPDTGGTPEDVSVLDSANGELQHNWPDPLPNGRSVLIVTDHAGPGINVSSANQIAVLDIATHKHKVLVNGIFAKYAKSGHLLYVTSSGVLMAAPFDQDRMEITGASVSLLEGVTVRRGGGGVDLTISENGTLWYGSGSSSNDREAAWATRSGQLTPVDSTWSGDLSTIAISPDGKRLAVSIVDATGEQLWVKRLDMPHGTMSKLTFEGVVGSPRWSPDASQLLFITRFGPDRSLRAVRTDGTNPTPQVLVRAPGEGRIIAARWSPDQRWIVYDATQGPGGTGRDIFATRTGGDTTTLTLASTKFAERDPAVSPDGRWLLFQASTNGATEIYVRPFPDASKGLYQVSSGGGRAATWSRDGKEIFYKQDTDLMRAAVVPGATFAFTDTRRLFSMRGMGDWDVAPDGRFIVIRDRGGQQRSKLVVVENFFQELNARVPR
jgi:serine/threonine protein kinase/Tol biopolymer transport system component